MEIVMDNYKVYCDGACEPNPGTGGYCSVIFKNGDLSPRVVIHGGEKDTTNNRMEIMGVLCVMRYLKEPSNIIIFSDSQYVCNSLNMWLDMWKRRGKIMKNMDLWDEIYNLKKKHKVRAQWIKGHSGNFFNEYADSVSMDAIASVNNLKRRKSFEKTKILLK